MHAVKIELEVSIYSLLLIYSVATQEMIEQESHVYTFLAMYNYTVKQYYDYAAHVYSQSYHWEVLFTVYVY